MSMSTVTASIVVPVYNSERYLEECVRSALSQTCESIEVICVDNGSTDGSCALLERLAREDARVRVVNEPRPGVSCARNAGMACARGEYLFFLDADDLMKPECVERAVSCARERDAQLVIYSFEEYYSDCDLAFEWPKSPDSSLYDRVFSLADVSIPAPFFVTPNVWRIAYRVSYLSSLGIGYEESLRSSEDLVFVYELLFSADRVALVDDVLYCYRKDSAGSLTKRDRDAAGLKALRLIHDTVYAKLRNCGWAQFQFVNLVLDTLDYQIWSCANVDEYIRLYAGYFEEWRPFVESHKDKIDERYRGFFDNTCDSDPSRYLYLLYKRTMESDERRRLENAQAMRDRDTERSRAEALRLELDQVLSSRSWILARKLARIYSKIRRS